ncbi:MAG: ferredoxin [Candidatus Heimdallarchaeota archaeon]
MVDIPRINRHECCGCRLCVYALPAVFRLTPEGISEVYATEGASKAEIQKVMDNCPISCVHWFKQ